MAECFNAIAVVLVAAVIADILAQQAAADADRNGGVGQHSGFNGLCRLFASILPRKQVWHAFLEPAFFEKNTEYAWSLVAWVQHIVFRDDKEVRLLVILTS